MFDSKDFYHREINVLMRSILMLLETKVSDYYYENYQLTTYFHKKMKRMAMKRGSQSNPTRRSFRFRLLAVERFVCPSDCSMSIDGTFLRQVWPPPLWLDWRHCPLHWFLWSVVLILPAYKVLRFQCKKSDTPGEVRPARGKADAHDRS